MNNKSSALFRAANVVLLDYPFEASLLSALALCDEAVIVVGQSVDDTRDLVYGLRDSLGAHRVKVIETEFVYDRGWQERWWKLAAENTDANWLWYHDADEAIHENDIPTIRAAMEDPTIELINFPYIHLFMTGSYVRDFHFPRNTRLGRRSAGYRMQNWCSDEHPDWPACQMVFGFPGREAHGWRGDNIAVLDTPIYHYSWCRDPYALQVKNMKLVDWYKDGKRFGLTDGRIPDAEPYDYLKEFRAMDLKGLVAPFAGTHPAVMADWLEQHGPAWRRLETQLNPFQTKVHKAFPLDLALALRDICGLSAFVETGTYKGDTARLAADHFDQVQTVEGAGARYRQLVGQEWPDNVRLWQGDSAAVLPEMLTRVHGPALLWLDAHWIYHGHKYEDDPLITGLSVCPVLAELAAADEDDAIMIDDARFFVRPPVKRGPVDAWPSLDQIMAALPGRYVFIYDDTIVAVPERYRATVRDWLIGEKVAA